MKPRVLIFVIIAIIVAVGFYGFSYLYPKNEMFSKFSKPQAVISPTSVDSSASFLIFTNGTRRTFSAPMYHNLNKDAFIEASSPNTVRVKKSGVTWDDFFKTLPFKLTKSCLTTGTNQTFCTSTNMTLKFYVNGKFDPNILDKQISDGDKLLVTFGNENEAQIQNQIQTLE